MLINDNEPMTDIHEHGPDQEDLAVLVVCSTNTTLSPMAEAILQTTFAEAQLPAQVRSAGLTIGRKPAHPYAIEVMRDRGLDLSGHHSSAVTLELVEEQDLIIGMTDENVSDVVAVWPHLAPRCHTLAGITSASDGPATLARWDVAAWARSLDETQVENGVPRDHDSDIDDPTTWRKKSFRSSADKITGHCHTLTALLTPKDVADSEAGASTTSPLVQIAQAEIAKSPNHVDVRALTAIFSPEVPPDLEITGLDQMCELFAGKPEQSTAYDRVVVHEESVEAKPEGVLFSDHAWPRAFERRDGSVPQVSVYRLEDATIAMTPYHDVVLDNTGAYVPEISSAPYLAPLYWGLDAERLSGRVLVAGTPGARMFSHWLLDVLPRIEAARLAGYDSSNIDHVLVHAQPSSFVRDSLAELGFQPEQIIYGRRQLPLYRVDELIAPTLVRQTKYTPESSRRFLRQLYLGDQADVLSPRSRKVVYISRQNSDRRRMHNHELLDDFLVATDAKTIHAEDLTVSEMAHELSDTALLLGPHGAGLANAVFLPPWAAGMEFTGVLFMPEFFQLISTSASKYALVTGDDDEGRDVLDPESMKAHLPLVANKDFKHRDILLNPERTGAALAWAEDFLDSL